MAKKVCLVKNLILFKSKTVYLNCSVDWARGLSVVGLTVVRLDIAELGHRGELAQESNGSSTIVGAITGGETSETIVAAE